MQKTIVKHADVKECKTNFYFKQYLAKNMHMDHSKKSHPRVFKKFQVKLN